MSETLDLKALEARAYRSFFADGLWDIFLGLTLLAFGVGAAVSRAGLEYLQTGNVSHIGELFSAITAGVGLIAASDSK